MGGIVENYDALTDGYNALWRAHNIALRERKEFAVFCAELLGTSRESLEQSFYSYCQEKKQAETKEGERWCTF